MPDRAAGTLEGPEAALPRAPPAMRALATRQVAVQEAAAEVVTAERAGTSALEATTLALSMPAISPMRKPMRRARPTPLLEAARKKPRSRPAMPEPTVIPFSLTLTTVSAPYWVAVPIFTGARRARRPTAPARWVAPSRHRTVRGRTSSRTRTPAMKDACGQPRVDNDGPSLATRPYGGLAHDHCLDWAGMWLD